MFIDILCSLGCNFSIVLGVLGKKGRLLSKNLGVLV